MNVLDFVREKYEKTQMSVCELGRGSFGSVFKVKVRTSEIAVKVIDLARAQGDKEIFAQAKKWFEYYYQEKAESNFVLKVRKSYLDDNFFCIEME